LASETEIFIVMAWMMVMMNETELNFWKMEPISETCRKNGGL